MSAVGPLMTTLCFLFLLEKSVISKLITHSILVCPGGGLGGGCCCENEVVFANNIPKAMRNILEFGNWRLAIDTHPYLFFVNILFVLKLS